MSKDPPQAILIRGKELACPICSNKTFYQRKALLNTETKTFLGMDFLDPNAYCFICSHCTHILWFME